ncbi:zinc finger, CCHC-type containing protein [Tanacetum coccineum]|uniref:Zinc finger, CCHC-type containing protein n=1 Tax=Tanacetum coccineum TaxID=301880 RepID=A0ABQ4X1H6_9ASTR
MDSIMGNNTWVLVDLPLGCKWIIKRKLKVDGTIEKFKARLVIQGFKQKSRIDYFDTYAPVTRISTIRLLIAMTSIHNLIINQMDVKTAFLNGDLEEEIQRISLTGFPAQSVGSSNTDVLDSPCLLVFITGTSQSRQHVINKIDSFRILEMSPTKRLALLVGSAGFPFHCVYLSIHSVVWHDLKDNA